MIYCYIKCSSCKGNGYYEGKECLECDGQGFIEKDISEDINK